MVDWLKTREGSMTVLAAFAVALMAIGFENSDPVIWIPATAMLWVSVVVGGRSCML